MTTTGAAGWHRDPSGRHEQRYFDGQRWTEHVATAGRVGVDPVPSPPVHQPVPATPWLSPPVVQVAARRRDGGSIAAAIGAGGVGLIDVADVMSTPAAEVGIGLWLTVAGAVAMVIGATVSLATRSNP